MILADKIINLRKKSGMSQEELADKLGVSRQAVSKWESTQSIPDLDKILLMSKLFGVSTDFLLKDELEVEEVKQIDDGIDTDKKKVTMEMANDFISKKFETSKSIAFGVFLCIISPITLIILGGLCSIYPLNENLMCGIGLITLFILVAIAVALFISSANKLKEYEFLETELFETSYGVTGMVKEKKKNFHDTYSKNTLIGVITCLLSVIPLFIGAFSNVEIFVILGLGIMLLLVAFGVFLLVLVGCKMSAMVMLLQEEDYSREKKKNGKLTGAISTLYWGLTTIIYLVWSLLCNNWDRTWIVWVVAGVLYGGIYMVMEAIASNKNK